MEQHVVLNAKVSYAMVLMLAMFLLISNYAVAAVVVCAVLLPLLADGTTLWPDVISKIVATAADVAGVLLLLVQTVVVAVIVNDSDFLLSQKVQRRLAV